MATTYLTLTNRVLRELNETELTSVRLVLVEVYKLQLKILLIKVFMIFIMKQVRYLLYSRTTQDLTVGDNEYDFPADFRKADMDSFSLNQKN